MFLKVLVQGKASLYYYSEPNFTRFFYSVNDSLILQLVYKEYLVGDNQTATNLGFHQQLLNYVKCDNITKSSIGSIYYNQRELEKYFKKYNECFGDTIIVSDKKSFRRKFNFRVTSGINYLSLSIVDASALYPFNDANFGSKINFGFGFEFEYVLPFNKNKWSLLLEPTYQFFNSQKEVKSGLITIEYRSVEFSIGMRHYFFLNDNTKIFINGFVNSISGFDINSRVKFSYLKTEEKMGNKINLALGGGMNFKSVSVELRYYLSKDILSNQSNWGADFQKTSFIIGYNLFMNRHSN